MGILLKKMSTKKNLYKEAMMTVKPGKRNSTEYFFDFFNTVMHKFYDGQIGWIDVDLNCLGPHNMNHQDFFMSTKDIKRLTERTNLY